MKSRKRRVQAPGFSLVEISVTLLITVMVMTAIVAIFQLNSKVAETQTQVAEMQQSLRIGQYDLVRVARMAGRGGVPTFLPRDTAPVFAGKFLPTGSSIEVENDVAANRHIVATDTTSPKILPGTDVLTVRGVFTTPVYQVNPADSDIAAGTLQVNFLSPVGVEQDLQPLVDAINRAVPSGPATPQPDALVLVSPLGIETYSVVELSGGSFTTGGGQPVGVQLNFGTSGGTYTTELNELNQSGIFSPRLTRVAFVGILEEYRFYIREDHAIVGDDTSELVPRLSRARFVPNTEALHESSTGQDDIADNVFDLQIALGVDSKGAPLTDAEDGLVTEAVDYDSRGSDEWLFNHPADTLDTESADPTDPTLWDWNFHRLQYIRITALARSDRPQGQYVSDPLVRIEDRDYNEQAEPVPVPDARRFRRRLIQTTVDLRNLT